MSANRDQSFGYLRATVAEPTVIIIDVTRHPEPVSLTFDVAEGTRYKVRDIAWSGMKAVDADQLFAILLIRPEDILDTSKVRATIEGVQRLHAAIGYPNASIVPQFQIHEAGYWVELYFNVDEVAQEK